MKYPGSDLHQLKGKMRGTWAVKVSGNWRIVFDFKEGYAYHINYNEHGSITPDMALRL